MHLMLHFTRADKADDRYAFQFGREEYQLHGKGRTVATATLNWNEALIEDLELLRKPQGDPSVVQRVGDRLRRFLAKAGWNKHEADVAEAVKAGEPVFITISSNAAELYALPWELLTLESSGQRIGELPGVLLRYAWPGTETVPESPGRPEGGRILFAHSDSLGAVPADEHQRAILDACERGFYDENFTPDRDVIARASLDAIAQALEEAHDSDDSIAVLHLLCHGTSSGESGKEVFGLGLSDVRGRTSFVSPDRLRAFLSQDFARQIRLVVLGACDSANLGAFGNQVGGVAQAVHQAGIPAVVASRFPLTVKGSVRIVETLYDELLGGPSSLEDGVLSARERLLREQDNLDWASMQLYSRPEDGDDTRPVTFRPYRGLLPFRARHTRFFFGRDAERAEVLSDLQSLRELGEPRFLVVAGASGTGKSSVVMGGAVPDLLGRRGQQSDDEQDNRKRLERALGQLERLHTQTKSAFLLEGIETLRRGASEIGGGEEFWEYVVMRPSSQPMTALEQALAERSDPDGALLLIVDQFEEIFTHTESSEVRQAFCRRLWHLASDSTGIHILITIRVDFLGACGEIVVDEKSGLRLDSVAYDERHRVFIPKMARDKLRESIEKPAQKVGLELQEGLAEKILDDVGNEPGALPLVQYTLDLLWQERRSRVLELAAYEALGDDETSGVIGALRKKADDVIIELDPEGRKQARRLLVRLVRVGDDGQSSDTRRRLAIDEIQPKDSGEAEAFDRVLKTLVGERLLVRGEEAGRATVEVAHEALIRQWPLLKDWVTEDRGMLVELAEIERWADDYRAHKNLLEGDALGYALKVQERSHDELSDTARTMISRSVARKRRNRLFKLATFVAMMLGIVVTVFLWISARSAEREARENLEAATASEKKAKKSEARAVTSKKRMSIMSSVACAQGLSDENPTEGAACLRRVDDFKDSKLNLFYRETAVETLQEPLASGRVFGPQKAENLQAANADGSVVLAQDERGRMLVGAPNAKEGRVLSGHQGGLKQAFISDDGRRVLAIDEARVARVWDAATGEQAWSSERSVTAAALSSDGARVAFASDDLQIVVTQLDVDGEPVVIDAGRRAPTKGHEMPVLSIAFSPDGERLVTGSQDKSARVWHIRRKRHVMKLTAHTAEISSVAFSPSGDLVVTASRDRTARVWRVAPKYGRLSKLSHPGQVVQATFRDEDQVITVTGGEVYNWNASGFGEPMIYRGHDYAVRVAYIASGGDRHEQMFTIDSNGIGRTWDLSSSNDGFFTSLRRHRQAISGAAFTPGGKPVTAGRDGLVCLWHGPRCEWINRGDRSEIFAMSVCETGEWVITASGTDAWMWPLSDGGRITHLLGEGRQSSHGRYVTSVDFSRDCETALTSSLDGTVVLWQVQGKGRGESIERIRSRPLSAMASARFRPAEPGRPATVGMVTRSGKAYLWNAETRELAELTLAERDGSPEQAGSAGDAAQGIGGDEAQKKADAKDNKLDSTQSNPIRALAFSATGDHVAVGAARGQVAVWRFTADGQHHRVSLAEGGHRAAVNAIAFNPEESCLLTGSDDGTGIIWSLGQGTCPFVARDAPPLELDKHKDAVRHALFHPRQDWAFTGSADGTLRLWDAARPGESIAASLRGASITGLAMSKDGERIVLGRADGVARTIDTTLDAESLDRRLRDLADRLHISDADDPGSPGAEVADRSE